MDMDDKEKSIRENVYLSQSIDDKLIKYAKDNGLAKSAVIAIALVDYFKQREITDKTIEIIEEMLHDPKILEMFIKTANSDEQK